MRLAMLSIATAALLVMTVGFGAQAHAAGNSNGPPPPDGTITVILGNSYTDDAYFSSSLGALPDSVSINIYAVTGPATIAIKVTDCCDYGDYYQLWESSSAGFTAPTLVGTTPQVHTDSSIVAPSYNPLWDGTGSTYSTATFVVAVPSGITYFAVRDSIQDAMGALLDGPCSKTTLQLVSLGCTANGISVLPDYLLAGFTIGFARSTSHGAPEFGTPPFMLAALALPLLFLLRRTLPNRNRSDR
jgi:hypothetical protein